QFRTPSHYANHLTGCCKTLLGIRAPLQTRRRSLRSREGPAERRSAAPRASTLRAQQGEGTNQESVFFRSPPDNVSRVTAVDTKRLLQALSRVAACSAFRIPP